MAAQVVVPQLGESVVEARVARWLKKEGDAVAVGDPLVELETEKIDLEVDADQAGVLAKILRQEGEDVKVGELLALSRPARRGGRARGTPAECAQPRRQRRPRRRRRQARPRPRHGAADGPRARRRRARPPKCTQVDMAQVQGSGDAGRVMQARRRGGGHAVPRPRAAQRPAPQRLRAEACAPPPVRPAAPAVAPAAAPRNACGCPSAA